ncbi:protein phosphatase 1E-like [Liolophura sinensis]|uniref:protein phosphatase 1E-like n=1 Tax=Liolophura sinensis TaxID=3198878 RepID=UPI0031595DCE
MPERMYEVYAHAIKNTRRKMEDRHIILHDLNSLFKLKGFPSQSYYAVYDGHGGVEAAVYTASHLHCHMVHNPQFDGDVNTAIKEAYRNTDNNFIEKAQREGLRSGTTCVTALIRGQMLHLAWLGDSQAVLVKDGQVHDVMNPHKPEREDEKKRIEDLGGVVVWFGTWRVNGNIAVSRAIGDIEHKPYISAVPDILSVELDGTEDYLILGCDGVWDTLPKEELPEIMYTYLQECDGDRTMVAQRLVSIARDNGSTDNISVVIVFFKDDISEPKPTRSTIEEAKRSDMDAKGKGDNCEGKENSDGDLSPLGTSGGLGSCDNNAGSVKKCNGVTSDKQNSSRKSRRDGSCNANSRQKKNSTKNGLKAKKKRTTTSTTTTSTKDAGKDNFMETGKKPLRSSSQINTDSRKSRSKSCTSRNKKVKNKTDSKETVWAFTGKCQTRVQNHRLNHRAQAPARLTQASIGPANSYMSKEWLSKTMTRILEKRQHGGKQTQPEANRTEEPQHETLIPWYAQREDELSDEEDGVLVDETLYGNQSTLYQTKGRSLLMTSGLKHQQGSMNPSTSTTLGSTRATPLCGSR